MSQVIILASGSARRKGLLKNLNIPFRIQPSRIKENLKSHLPAEDYAISLALAKAENIAAKLKQGLVIGADTIVVFANKIIGKPKDTKDAKRILKTLSNTKHVVYTAIAVVNAETKRRIVDIEKTIVYTRKLSPRQIKDLAAKHLDKAGAYAVQEKRDLFVKKIDGDYYNVVGLPVSKLKNILNIFK